MPAPTMKSEGVSFAKGILLGGLFYVLLYVFNIIDTKDPQLGEHHFHHHVHALSQEELQRMPESVKLQLSSNLRVYCVVMLRPKLLVHWAAAKDTWIKHCDKAQYYTSEGDKVMDAMDLQEQNEWAMIRKALNHAFHNADGLRWFFLARPSTFAIIENLKFLVLGKDSEQPFYIGRVAKAGELDYVEYDSGVVLSHEALRRLVAAFADESRCPKEGHSLWSYSEEKELALCLRNTGVFAENGEDSQGKSLFNRKSISTLISDSMASNPSEVMKACCPDLAVTFGDMSPNQMQVLMFGVYRLRPYGHDFHDSLIVQPPEASDND